MHCQKFVPIVFSLAAAAGGAGGVRFSWMLEILIISSNSRPTAVDSGGGGGPDWTGLN